MLNTQESSSRNRVVEPISANPPPDLFPLPLTPFEQLMIDDDCRQYPRTFIVTIEFQGELQRGAFQEAVEAVVRRNPLLSARIKKHRSTWCWMEHQFVKEQVTWGECTWEENPDFISLRKSPGFRACGQTDGSCSQVRLLFHHAVCDGQGARRVILDLATSYSQAVNPERQVTFDPLNYDRLRCRGQYPQTEACATDKQNSEIPMSVRSRLKTVYDFFSQQPDPIRCSSPPWEQAAAGKEPPHASKITRYVETSHFGQQEVNQFRDRLRGTRVTFNDAAIALALHSIAKWNQAHGERRGDRLYRILVPADLREFIDRAMPAGNRISFLFLTRPAELCLNFSELLPTIRAEMEYIQQHGSKFNLVNALPLVQSIPAAMKIATRLPVCLSTAVLTNVGDTLRKLRNGFPDDDGRPVVGNLRFIGAAGAPPLRSKTALGIGLTMSFGELTIKSQFDAKVFSRADAAEFQRVFTEQWQRCAATGSPT